VKPTKRIVVATCVAVLALVLATGALAGKPPAYQGTAGSVQGLVQKGNQAAPAATKTVGQLPFTGLDLMVFAAGAGALIVAGFSFRRLGQRRSD